MLVDNETPLRPVKVVVGSALTILVLSAVSWGLWYVLTQGNNPITIEVMRAALAGLFWGFLLVLVLLFIALFTGKVEQTSPSRMIWMICFSYLFTGLALGGSLLPFVLFELQNDSLKGTARLEEIMTKNPIGILKGCVEANVGENIPKAIDCKDGRHYLWVVNIGGSPVAFDEDTEKASTRNSLDALQPTANNVVALSDYGSPSGSGLLTGGALGQETADIFTAPNEFQDWKPRKITGGLVVPLYVVIISLMAAAVSMTRRVPEFQRRFWAWYRLDEEDKSDTKYSESPRSCDSGPLSPDCARECLIFQMMQVISAPLVAVTAYYAIAPTGVAATVGLAFAAGFASEPILITISTFGQKLRPDVQRLHANNNGQQHRDSSSQRTLG